MSQYLLSSNTQYKFQRFDLLRKKYYTILFVKIVFDPYFKIY